MTTQSAESISPSVALPPQSAELVPPEVIAAATRLGVLQHLPAVIGITQEIFGPFSRVRVVDDPEFRDDIHIIFHVPARGTVEEELNREAEWGRRVAEIIPRSPQVYLVFVDYWP